MQPLSQGFFTPLSIQNYYGRVKNNHTKEILFRMLCYEKVALLFFLCEAITRYNNSVNNSHINRFFSQILGQIVLGLFNLTSLRSVNSEKPRTICPGIDLKTG